MKVVSFLSHFIPDADGVVSDYDGFEVLDETSMSVPDMSLSVRQILERFRRGSLDLASLDRSQYEISDDMSDYSDVEDLVDMVRLRNYNKNEIDRLVNEINSYRGTLAEDPKGNNIDNTE